MPLFTALQGTEIDLKTVFLLISVAGATRTQRRYARSERAEKRTVREREAKKPEKVCQGARAPSNLK